MKILKKGGGSREQGGGRNEIHAPCACDFLRFALKVSAYQNCDFHLYLKEQN